MEKQNFKKGEYVYVKLNWAGDDHCWYGTTVIKETEKRVQVETLEIRGDKVNPYFAKHNVKRQNDPFFKNF